MKMDVKELKEYTKAIRPVDGDAMDRAASRQADLAKPPGSLGGLEEISIRLAGILGTPWEHASGESGENADPGARKEAPGARGLGEGCVLVFCADNGVVRQGVSSAPQSVTRAQTINFTRRLTGVGALAKSFGGELLIVDVGVKDPIPEELYDSVPLRDTAKIIDRRIRRSTWDIHEGPAMTQEEALRAMKTGIEMAEAAADAGYSILGIGEMGIGNTTTSAAVLSALAGLSAEETCGRGGGVNDDGFAMKKNIVSRAEGFLKSDAKRTPEDVIRTLVRWGGFDLCAMTGAFLGAAARQIPVVIDGYISAVAALAAAMIAPESVGYMFASHRSAEPGYTQAIGMLGLKPFLSLDMRLGEGSGCPIAFAVIRGAWDVMLNMATFAEAEINDDYLEEIREMDF